MKLINVMPQLAIALGANFKKHKKLYIFPPKGEYLENLIYNAFLEIGVSDIQWDPGSHKKGADITVLGENVSVKTGKVNSKWMILSSHRTTQHKGLQSKLDFILEPHEDSYIAVSSGNLYYFPTTLIKDELKGSVNLWTETINKLRRHSGWKYVSKNGFDFSIRKSMSDQLWIKIPISYTRYYTYPLKDT